MAEALRDWLPLCIQSLEPWMSAADIDKGARWFEEVEGALEAANGRGIFCVTPENLGSPWLNFEAGVVASRGGKARVCSLLLALNQDDVPPPLSLFQLTPATRGEILKLLKSLNKDCPKPVVDRVLDRAFDANWDELSTSLTAAQSIPVGPGPAARPQEDTLAEVLGIVRRVEQLTSAHSSSLRRLSSRQHLEEQLYGLATASGLPTQERNKARAHWSSFPKARAPNALEALLVQPRAANADPSLDQAPEKAP